jgi:hypothetical protein
MQERMEELRVAEKGASAAAARACSSPSSDSPSDSWDESLRILRRECEPFRGASPLREARGFIMAEFFRLESVWFPKIQTTRDYSGNRQISSDKPLSGITAGRIRFDGGSLCSPPDTGYALEM